MKTAIFIERDGVLNVPRLDRQHQRAPQSMAEFEVNLSAIPVFETLKSAGFLLIVTTNQPGLSSGYLSRRDLDLMHQEIRRTFPVDDILVCPHTAEDHCSCRKPQAGLFTEAAFKYQVDLERSFVISDKWQDARAARDVGCTSLMLQSPWVGNGHHDFVLSSLHAIAGKIMQLQNRHLAA
jgi:D-glycero-D-manno-heptose 1,7-bisphosphate phosphatase